MRQEIRIDSPTLRRDVAETVREARRLTGWSQTEVAARAGTSQSRVSRLEREEADDLDLVLLADVLRALGYRGTFEVSSVALEDRREQRAPVHGIILADTVRRLRRWGWQTATEVEIPGRDGAPRGWIDLLAYRDADAAGLLGEIKGDIPDPGALQRQVAFYERNASSVMRTPGWRPGSISTLVIALDTWAVHATVRAHAALLADAFPGAPPDAARWLRTAGSPTPPRTLALVDPGSRDGRWLRRSPVSGRRSTPAYDTYARAAQALTPTRPRPPRGPPGTTTPSTRSRPP